MKQQQPRSIFLAEEMGIKITDRNLRLALNITEYRIETMKNICELLYNGHVVLTEPTD